MVQIVYWQLHSLSSDKTERELATLFQAGYEIKASGSNDTTIWLVLFKPARGERTLVNE